MSIVASSFSGQIRISFDFTVDEAYSLVTLLGSGPLPLEMHETGFGDREGSGPSEMRLMARLRRPSSTGR